MHILVIYFTVVPAFFFVLIKDVSKREDKPKNDYEGCKNEKLQAKRATTKFKKLFAYYAQ